MSVSPQCAGARRCPLFVFVPASSIENAIDWLGPVVDKYGMILLAVNQGRVSDPKIMDAVLQEVLQKFAVDPAKIAIMGRCASAMLATQLGVENLHVFSRIAAISGDFYYVEGLDPKNQAVEFLIDGGMLEWQWPTWSDVPAQMRRDGHSIKVVRTLRGHEHQAEDYDFLGHWLQESWAIAPAARPAPAVVADPVPLLTPEALTRMTTFWTAFLKEPDSIRMAGRRTHLREVALPAIPPEEATSTWITDMAALAAQYPAVAADLKKAELTAQQHDAYRIALISAHMLDASGEPSTSVLARNGAFLREHQDEWDALEKAGLQDLTPDAVQAIQTIGDWNPGRREVEKLGAMGIWRMP